MKYSNLWKLIAVCWYSLLLIGICLMFWYKELIYPIPTPVPPAYIKVNPGETVDIPAYLKVKNTRPVFLHFFDPDCSCSRFNITHFKSLVNRYGSQVNFSIVVTNNKRFSAREIQEKFGIDIPVSFDTTLARSCGVYSTPQAVIIDPGSHLYYRGNYNRSRYCTNKKTNYAEIALNDLLNRHPISRFDQYSSKAYGCSLPKCTNPQYVKR